jgi:N4-gp56 family major capsid protein
MAWPAGVSIHASSTANFGANAAAAEYLQSKFQDELFATFLMYPLGVKAELPRGMGKTVTWIKFAKGTTAITANTEGDIGFALAYTNATVQATLAEFIGYSDYSELMDLTAVNGTTEQISKNLAAQAALTVDRTIFIDAMADATNTNDEGVAMTAEGIRKAVSELAVLNVPHHSSTPGGAFYCAVLTAEEFYDMIGEGAPTWVQAMRQELTAALKTPWETTTANSAIYDCLIKKSNSNPAVSSNNVSYVFGDGAFGTVDIGPNLEQASLGGQATGYLPQLIPTTPGEATYMPGRNKGTFAAKWYYAAEMLDANSIVELLSDVT